MNKCISILLLALTLTGCSTLKGKFDNVAVCELGSAESYLISLWGFFGISSKIANGNSICPTAAAVPSQGK